MKNLMKISAALLLISVIFAACSKKDDPADKDLFVGTYKGTVDYKAEGVSKHSDDGHVRVVKTGNNYYFVFSDDIPNLTGVEFEKGENSVISIGSDEAKYIKVTANSLKIAYTKDGAIWTADCTR
ncbi:hypothetical protein [Pseudopedobacter beijingensis]|uniref:Lipoprotein n=1 Tax=Pseudopedobacter beijingensis TaxID=1207056 RepID=A0ABW4IC18_9SPHI